VGWARATRMTILQVLISLIMFELLFYSWQKLPFTCSHQPGDRPIMAVVARYLAILGVAAPILSVMVAASAEFLFLFPIYFLNFAGLWIWARRERREGWGETKLLYEDTPAVVTDLGIKELTYKGSVLYN